MIRSRSGPITVVAGWCFLGVACNAPDPPGSTGGTDEPAGECGRGIVVVSSDKSYASTNVSLLAFDGRVLSASFISSATESAELSAPLSGDVFSPTSTTSGDEIVLIDRAPASVVTWVDVVSAEVRAQLSLATGFKANPHDYVPFSANKAYVTRYDSNAKQGREPHDAGSDLLVIDPAVPGISKSIAFAPAMAGEDARFLPRGDRAVRAGDKLYAVLTGYSLGFDDSAESRIVEVDPATDSITAVHVLEGLHGCWGLALSPRGTELAVGCSGSFLQGPASRRDESGVAIVSVGNRLEERQRIRAETLGDGAVGFGISYASEQTLLVVTLGSFGDAEEPARDDVAFEVDLVGGQAREVARSSAEPFSLGDARCAPACNVCFLTDSEASVVYRYDVGATGELGERSAIAIDDGIGLQPRSLGGF
jgi:hypothetical protein